MHISRIVGIAMAAAAAGLGGWLWWQSQSSDTNGVLTAAVTRAPIEQTVLASGILKPSRLVAVGAQVSGRITAVHVSVGQPVSEGDLIAEIDSVTQQNELRTAEASLASARAQRAEKEATLTLNQRSLERQAQMLSRGTTTSAEYDSAIAAVAVTRAQIDALDAQIAQSELGIETAVANLGYTQITAPIAGTVLAIVSQEGQTVNATSATPTIVILGQLDVMTVHTEISEADIGRVRSGQPLWFTTLGDTSTRYDGELGIIEPAPATIRTDSTIDSTNTSTSSASAVYYNGTFDVPNADGLLRTYQTVQVSFVLGRTEDALVIPVNALGAQGTDGRVAVQVQAADGRIEVRQVATGLNSGMAVEITDGVSEGERVVIGQALSRAGSSAAAGGPPMMMGF
ncbi:efflux RND transporter periplasmic adaptor subunit [Pararhodobacter sp.]|uniref:efflux RND transporter periplasmic adaptor subunit n=1 Tax=Pararhodobacter sp. TaxID=2127056 RepID=UPI002FDCFDCA